MTRKAISALAYSAVSKLPGSASTEGVVVTPGRGSDRPGQVHPVNQISDVQTESPVHGGLSRFGREAVAECDRLGIVEDCAHASFDTTMAVLEASEQPVIISHGQFGHLGAAQARLLTPAHVTVVDSGGGLVGAWPAGLASRSLADFATEIIRLAEVVGPGRVGIRTDLDGNYRIVLTSYQQLADLAGLLYDAGSQRPMSGRSSAATPQTC